MAKSLYSALFDWIVLRINHALLNKKDMEEAVSVSGQALSWARINPILGASHGGWTPMGSLQTPGLAEDSYPLQQQFPTCVLCQIPCMSDIYIIIPNSSKITVTKEQCNHFMVGVTTASQH